MKLPIHILKHYAPMLPLIVGFYGVRLLWWDYSYGEFRIRPPLILVQVLINLVVLGLVGLAIATILALVILISLRLSKSSFPSGLLLIGIFLMMLLPLPEPPPLPETAHFLAYRADYEHVLQLIQSKNANDTRPNYCTYPPSEFQHISLTECIDVSNSDSGFFVRFNSLDPYYNPIVYIESDEEINYCLYDFYIEEKIDDHWYVCFEDWN